MVKAPVKPAWIIPIASLITMIAGMVGDTLHPGINVDQAHIETLLMMLLGSGAIGAANSMHKRKTVAEKPKEEPSTDEVQEEIAEKVEEEVEKVKAVVKEELIKEVQKVPPQMFKKLMTPEEFSELSPQQQDQYTSSGGIVTRFIKNTEGIKWNNASDGYDSDFDHDPEKGNVVKYGTRYLHIRVGDAKSGHTVVLQNSADKILVIDQKGENEISALRLANPDGSPLEKGEYKLTVTAMLRSTSYTNSWEDGFWIV